MISSTVILQSGHDMLLCGKTHFANWNRRIRALCTRRICWHPACEIVLPLPSINPYHLYVYFCHPYHASTNNSSACIICLRGYTSRNFTKENQKARACDLSEAGSLLLGGPRQPIASSHPSLPWRLASSRLSWRCRIACARLTFQCSHAISHPSWPWKPSSSRRSFQWRRTLIHEIAPSCPVRRKKKNKQKEQFAYLNATVSRYQWTNS